MTSITTHDRIKRVGLLLLAFFVLLFGQGIRPAAAASDAESRFVVAVAAGVEHVLALAKDGSVWAWGDNSLGQLGLGDQIKETTSPQRVAGVDNVLAIAAGNHHSLALSKDGTVWVWGSNVFAQKGDGTYSEFGPPDQDGGRSISVNRNVYKPVKVPALSVIVGITATPNGGIARDAEGRLWQWGDSMMSVSYQGMDMALEQRKLTPHSVDGIGKIVDVAAGSDLLAAIDQEGELWIVGSGPFCQYGDGSRGRIVRTLLVPGIDKVVRVNLAEQSVVAYLSDGSVKEWGRSLLEGQGFNPTDSSVENKIPVHLTPVRTPQLQGFSELISTTKAYIQPSLLGLKPDGSVWTRGSNAAGQLGVGGIKERNDWARVEGLPSIVSADGFSGFCAAVGADGSVWTWGYSNGGRLADNTKTSRPLPKAVQGFGISKPEAPVPPSVPADKADNGFQFIVNGKSVALTAKPEMKNGSPAMMLGELVKAYGAKLTYDKTGQSAVLVRGKWKVALKLGSDKAVVNGKTSKLAFATYRKGSNWMAPADSLAKLLGGSAKLDALKRSLKVTLGKA